MHTPIPMWNASTFSIADDAVGAAVLTANADEKGNFGISISLVDR